MFDNDSNIGSRCSTAVALSSVTAVIMLLLFPVILGDQTLFFRDLCHQYIGTGRFIRSSDWVGGLLWDPFLNGGQPLLGNPNRFLLYPSRLLYLVLTPVEALNWEIAFHLFLGGSGAVLLARRLGVSGAGSAVTGIAFSIGGLSISITNHLGRLIAFHWLPWVLLAVHAGLCERGRTSWRWQVSIPILFAVQWLTGTAEIVAITGAFAVGWAAFCVQEPVGKRLTMARCIGLFVLSIGLASIQILPAIEMVSRSDRTSYAQRGATLEWSMNPLRLPEMVIPGFLGPVDVADPKSHYWGSGLVDHGFPLILSVYLGASVGFLALFGWAVSRRDSRWSGLRLFFAVLFCCALVVACGRYFPFIGNFWSSIPGLSFLRFPVKALLVIALPVAFLAGRGVDGLLKLDSRGLQRVGLACLATAMVFLGTARWVALDQTVPTLGEIFPARGQMAADGLSGPLTHVAMCLGTLALAVWLSSSIRSRIFSLLIVATVAADLLVASSATLPTAPRELLSRAPSLIKEIRSELSIGRFFRDQWPVESAMSPVEGEAWEVEAWRLETLAYSAAETFLVPMMYQIDIADLSDRRMARLRRATDEIDWGGRANLFQAGAIEIVLSPEAPDVPGLEIIRAYSLNGRSDLFLYRVSPNPTMARWVGSGRMVNSPEEALGTLVAPDFDPITEVVRERTAPVNPKSSSLLLSIQPDSELWRQVISAPMIGFVSTAIPWHPDVVVKVNGRSVPVERVNYAFAGFKVGPGRHEIEITFASRKAFWGGIISVLSIAVWAVFAVATWRSRNDNRFKTRPNHPE